MVSPSSILDIEISSENLFSLVSFEKTGSIELDALVKELEVLKNKKEKKNLRMHLLTLVLQLSYIFILETIKVKNAVIARMKNKLRIIRTQITKLNKTEHKIPLSGKLLFSKVVFMLVCQISR